MSAAQPIPMDAQSQYAGILERTLYACVLAQRAAAAVADSLGNGNLEGCWRTVDDAERQLDRSLV